MLDRPVWVSLATLFNPHDRPPVEPERDRFVIVDGEVEGTLHAWWRGSQGQWLGAVTYSVKHADGLTQTFERQLVPVEALRPRGIGVMGGGPW